MRTLREISIDLIYMESRNRQDLLSKLGAWGRRGEKRKGREGRKVYSALKTIKIIKS